MNKNEKRPTFAEQSAKHEGRMAMAEITRQSLAAAALEKHRTSVETSHLARIALERLEASAIEQGVGKAEIGLADLEAVKEILRSIQQACRLAFLQAYGSEDAYQAIGQKMDKAQKPRRRGRPRDGSPA